MKHRLRRFLAYARKKNMHRIFKGFSILALVLSASFFFLAPNAARATVIERLEAAVNNQLILKSDLTRFRKTLGLRSQLDPLFNGTPIAADGVRATDKDILEFLIDEKMIVQQFPMSDSEVEQEVNSIQVNNHITREQLRQAIVAQGYRFADYFDLIRVGAAKRNLIDREIRTKVTVSDDDIRNYYYGVYAKGKTAPQAFQVEMITQKDRSKINEAFAAVRSGTPFADVAKKYSEDSSADAGGVLGVFTEEQMNKNIRAEVTKMKVGETSTVLGNAKTGFFFLRLAGIQAGDDAKLKQASDAIRGQLASGEYQRQLQLWLERQRQTAFIRRAGDAPAAGLPKGI